MKAFAAKAPGLENCGYMDLPEPKPQNGEVLVKLDASALNHLDLWIARGHPSYKTQYPRVLGSDGAGILEETGARVALFSSTFCGKCDACLRGLTSSCDVTTTLGAQRDGTHAEYVSVPKPNAVPTTLDPQKAGSLSVAAVTAYHMLKRAELKAGQSVLVWGAASSVGSYAIQIAKHLECKVITTASTEKKGHAEKRFGVPVIDYKTEDVSERVRELTQGRGVDVVVELVGPATWNASMPSVRKGGAIVTCGAVSGPDVVVPLRWLYSNQIRFIGSKQGTLEEFKQVIRWAEEGAIEPVIESTYPLSEAKKAFQQLSEGKGFGKIVLTR
ncbi:zinc-binding dehydrogenase [Candidatus Micrarchaeota archaeon]|nr:zinc-binding dehydrogenase [Candidatus Micrarchaeota archaeon]